MSTRGGIARVVGTGKFLGRYHHWDSYPSGLGKTLFDAYRGHFGRDLGALLKFLIDDHHEWSTVVGADFALPSGTHDNQEDLCAECGKAYWRHYKQNYESHGEAAPEFAVTAGGPYAVFGHSMVVADTPKGPACYCHNDRTGGPRGGADDAYVDEQGASSCGIEWVYAFEARPESFRLPARNVMHVLSSYSRDGGKMIGMFGSGDPDAFWKVAATVELDGDDEPDWESMGG